MTINKSNETLLKENSLTKLDNQRKMFKTISIHQTHLETQSYLSGKINLSRYWFVKKTKENLRENDIEKKCSMSKCHIIIFFFCVFFSKPKTKLFVH